MYTNMFSMALPQSPLYIAWVVGFALALARWQRHPRVSLLAVCGFALLLLGSLLGNYVTVMLPVMLGGNGIEPRDFGVWFVAFGVARSLISAVGTGLLVAAIFSGRRSEQ